VVTLTAVATLVALLMALVAQGLTRLIGLITNLAFYGRWETSFVSPAGNHLGWAVVAVPALGGVLVGLMARFGSKAIRGHGIPEAMEQVLTNESRIPRRMTFLKPLSAALAIGTGGPFGAEGPIIATGGALGSWAGQLLATTAAERKTLLAAGAAAGMAATFGSPLSALLLAVELLLFEYRPQSLIPVAWAAVVAAGARVGLVGSEPVFALSVSGLSWAGPIALLVYALMGALLGLASVVVTKAVYAIEDAFEHVPVHWMWWPALGGVVVGLCGVASPRTLGVGYDNIEGILNGVWSARTVGALCFWKFVSWSVSLGSGTSGGTLAPLLTLGGGLGFVLGVGATRLWPHAGLDPRMAALVGMAAMFAGSSRAMLASLVFAFETTQQPAALLPLLAASSAAFLVSCLRMRHSIMTEKLARRGVPVLAEYSVDPWAQIAARQRATAPAVTLRASQAIRDVRAWLASGAEGSGHQGFPVVDDQDRLVGVVTTRDLARAENPMAPLASLVERSVVSLSEHATLREVADCMAKHHVGRIPLVEPGNAHRVVGIVTRSDLLRSLRA